jgi:ankyrin repeat protein
MIREFAFGKQTPEGWLPFSAAVTKRHAGEFLSAVNRNDINQVLQLLQQGLDPHLVNDRAGFTPLIIAVYKNFHEIVELLLMVYHDLEQGDVDAGFTALAWGVRQNHLRMVQLLVQHGANVDGRDKQGISIINMAYANAGEEVFLELLRNSNSRDPQELSYWKKWACDKGWLVSLEFINGL